MSLKDVSNPTFLANLITAPVCESNSEGFAARTSRCIDVSLVSFEAKIGCHISSGIISGKSTLCPLATAIISSMTTPSKTFV
jgi:hypothetical protein